MFKNYKKMAMILFFFLSLMGGNSFACVCHCFSPTILDHVLDSDNFTWDSCAHACTAYVERFVGCYDYGIGY